MLAAIISLLLVILFVLLLHIYARWFLVQARQRSRSSVNVPNVLGSRFHRFTIIDTTSDSSPSKGLHPSLISSLPLFVYYNPKDEAKQQHGLECAICISSFEEEEVGRKLPKCSHAFHVECIDMWLHSHSTCPICRAAVVSEAKMNVEIDDSMPEMLEELSNFTGDALHLEIDVVEDLSMGIEDNVSFGNDLVSGFSSLESSLGGSLKRILSSNRAERGVV